ncbi:uncharacterized protein LOC122320921 [Drosophila ficusphila]|uniref:uncharacterized protein LOC122320921 n=1 Tax=Drosophila ficusphila TaxID=30025 RepID=UPI001C89FE2E|nr:uncharacterized protein LOC122320921 [Drosophila ficusphila]
MDKIIENLSLAEIKTLCQKLDVPSSGNKATLKSRLLEKSSSELQKSLSQLKNNTSKKLENKQNANIITKTPQEKNNDKIKKLQICEIQTLQNYNDAENAAEVLEAGAIAEGDDEDNTVMVEQKSEIEKMREEENELNILKAENENLKKQLEMMKLNSVDKNDAASDAQNDENRDGQNSFLIIKDFVSVYDGLTNANLWITQLENIKKTYRLNDIMMRGILNSKLTGEAHRWLHARPNWICENIDDLWQQFKITFEFKENKLRIRKNFEQRKWQPGEPFGLYFNEKLVLANKLTIDEDELIEYIIDGIPNRQIKNQVIMQKIDDKENLLRTLADVELKMPASRNLEAAPNNAMKEKRDDYKKGERCYNCNSVGHYAADCNKPKRKPGSCYACGSESHTINDCPMNKKKKTPTQNDYNV